MTTISLRDIPESLYQEIKELAEQERRSINQQILVLLERAIAHPHHPAQDVVARIHHQRALLATRSGLQSDSTTMLLEDRNR
jgi:antitoxin FitA